MAPATQKAEGPAAADRKEKKKEKPEKPKTEKAEKAEKPKAEPKEPRPAASPFAGDVSRMIRYGKLDAQQQAALEAKAKESDAAYARFRDAQAPKVDAAQAALGEAKKGGDAARIADAQAKVDALKAEDKAFVQAERAKQLALLTPPQRHGFAGHLLWNRIWRQFDGVGMTKEQEAKADEVCARIAAQKVPDADAYLKDGANTLRGAEPEAIAAVEAEVMTDEQRAKLPAVRAEQAAKQQQKNKKDAPAAGAAK